MKEIYLIYKVEPPTKIIVEDGKIIEASKELGNFLNQQLSVLQDVLGKQKQTFILKKVDEDVNN
jgi:hypothetical protein